MLFLLAALPVLALTTFAGNQIVAVTETQQDLAAIELASAQLNDLITLETALDAEIYWGEGSTAVDNYGIDNDFISSFLGLDIEANLAESQIRVDDALSTVADPVLTAAINGARQSPKPRIGVISQLSQVSDGILAREIEAASDDLLSRASGLPDGEVLMYRAETLTDANDLRSSFNELLGAYFFFLVYGGERPVEALVAAGSTASAYADAGRVLDLGLEEDSELASLRRELAADESVLQIVNRTEASVADFDQQAIVSLDFADPTALIDLASAFGIANEASLDHLLLVQAATDNLETELAVTRAEEGRRAVVIGAITLAIVITTIVALVVVTRSIVNPIRRLGHAAEALSTGERIPPLGLSGPAEIQAATLTLNHAARNLRRAESQALALADGRLDDVSFDEGATGRLGRSLDLAVGRLRSSLSESEDFRQRLAHEATHDGLTGLPNRGASIANLEEALDKSEVADTQLAVLFIDLDGLKSVNDLHGHGAGDQLLNTVANRLQSACRPGDKVGRLGGDEFLIVTEPIASMEAAHAVAERVRTEVGGPIEYEGQHFFPTVSIGVALAQAGRDADEVIREADLAVYEAKNAGRDQTRVFDDAMRAMMLEEADLSAAITRGLAGGEFYLSLQPIVVAADRSIREYEALLRWNRGGIENVPPDCFIEFAEKSDLILDIDRWVLDEGARHLAEFDKREGFGEIRLSLNISGRHLLRADLFGDLKASLDRWQVDPQRLTIEITESALLDDLEAAGETLRRVRSLGVSVAIDDFGTGYTSLGHLRDLPADVLKIDRSFTQNLHRPDDISLVRLVTETGHLLGMQITVEGVETLEQEELLTSLGVDFQQGFWFGRPCPFDQLSAVASPVEVLS